MDSNSARKVKNKSLKQECDKKILPQDGGMDSGLNSQSNDNSNDELTKLRQGSDRESSQKSTSESDKMEVEEETETSNLKGDGTNLLECKKNVRERDQGIRDLKTKLETAQDKIILTEKRLSLTNAKYNQCREELVERGEKLAQCKKQLEEYEHYYNKYCEEYFARTELKENIDEYIKKQTDVRENLKSLIDEQGESFEEFCNSRAEKYKTEAFSRLTRVEAQINCHKDEICMFLGSSESKTYLHIQEMIQRAIEEVDKVKAQRYADVRDKKRELIQFCNKLDEELQRKARKRL